MWVCYRKWVVYFFLSRPLASSRFLTKLGVCVCSIYMCECVGVGAPFPFPPSSCYWRRLFLFWMGPSSQKKYDGTASFVISSLIPECLYK
jgi:hypothetical protein